MVTTLKLASFSWVGSVSKQCVLACTRHFMPWMWTFPDKHQKETLFACYNRRSFNSGRSCSGRFLSNWWPDSHRVRFTPHSTSSKSNYRQHTGTPVDKNDITQVRTSVNQKVFIGSGTSAKNILHYADSVDGFIIGSEFKEHGYWENEIDPKRVKEITSLLSSKYWILINLQY